MFAPKNILVPTDFSSYADHALHYALDIAQQYHAQVLLFHVIDENIQQCTVEYCLTDAVIREIEEESIKRSTASLQEQIKRATGDRSEVKIVPSVKRGVPYNEILREQEENNIDLLVIASHGRTGIKRLLIGSVAEKIVRSAKCPVMLVRT